MPKINNFPNLVGSSQNIFIDFDKIKILEGVSAKLYEAGAFRIGKLTNKRHIGMERNRAVWTEKADVPDLKGEDVTKHKTVCLVIPRVATHSFALQLFDIFMAFIHLEYFRKHNTQLKILLFDSCHDKISTLFFNCLPDCRLSQEMKGIHQFQGIFFLPKTGIADWRSILYTCGKAKEFHRFLLSSFDLTPPPPIERVKNITLIRRKKYLTDGNKPCGDRLIENEDILVKELSERYTQVRVQGVFLEDLPLSEQFALFAKTDVLIGMHGAGLISGAYCLPPNAGFIELFPKYYRDQTAALTCHVIAEERGIHYARWVNHNRRNESGEDARAVFNERYVRNPVHNNSVTYVPPKALFTRIDRLIRKIEHARKIAVAA